MMLRNLLFFFLTACPSAAATRSTEVLPDDVQVLAPVPVPTVTPKVEAPLKTPFVPTTITSEAVSGERLKTRFWKGADGSKKFISLYDSLIGADCREYAYGPNGEHACVPDFVTYTLGSFYHLDSGCTDEGFVVLPKGSKLFAASVDSKAVMTEALGERDTPVTLYKGTVANCVADSPNTFDKALFQVGATLPFSYFVAMTSTVE